MTRPFEELGRADTPAGPITLRRRLDPSLGEDVWEVKLGDEFLMSSLFTVAEIELARQGLAVATGASLDVLVGGLGLGYTATAALADPRVGSLVVIEALDEVIRWHEQRLLPESDHLLEDERTRVVHGDFFAMASSDDGFDVEEPGREFHAILVDIDHSPRHHLVPSHSNFYSSSGLASMARFLQPGGVFALWSDDPPDDEFLAVLDVAFSQADAHVVEFQNRLTRSVSTNTVYVAR